MSDRPIPPGTQWLRQQTQQVQQPQGPAAGIPYGPIQTRQQRILSHYNDLGPIRPLGPGEALQMPDGGITSEETYTVQLANGKWAVVPGLWLVHGVPHHVEEDQAAQFANMSGLDWAFSFDNQQEADAYAQQRENTWEQTPKSLMMTMGQPALWARRASPVR